MAYAEATIELMKKVNGTGFNIFAMLHYFRKRTKLRYEVPEPVVKAVCMEYFKRQGTIDKSFPYFLEVVAAKSREHFALMNRIEGFKIKNTPPAIKDIMQAIFEHTQREEEKERNRK